MSQSSAVGDRGSSRLRDMKALQVVARKIPEILRENPLQQADMDCIKRCTTEMYRKAAFFGLAGGIAAAFVGPRLLFKTPRFQPLFFAVGSTMSVAPVLSRASQSCLVNLMTMDTPLGQETRRLFSEVSPDSAVMQRIELEIEQMKRESHPSFQDDSMEDFHTQAMPELQQIFSDESGILHGDKEGHSHQVGDSKISRLQVGRGSHGHLEHPNLDPEGVDNYFPASFEQQSYDERKPQREPEQMKRPVYANGDRADQFFQDSAYGTTSKEQGSWDNDPWARTQSFRSENQTEYTKKDTREGVVGRRPQLRRQSHERNREVKQDDGDRFTEARQPNRTWADIRSQRGDYQ